MVIAPWLPPPDFIGAARAGSEIGLSEAQMHQQAAEHAAELALKRDALAAEMSRSAAENNQKQQQQNAVLALREAALKQEGVLGGQRVQNQADAISARDALERYKADKPQFVNTGGGLMQQDPVTKQWSVVPGSVKPDMQTVTTHVPPDVTPEKTIPGDHFWNANTVIPAVTNTPGYSVTRRIPVGAATVPPAIAPSAASALTKAQSGLPDFGPSTNASTTAPASTFKSADEVKGAYRANKITYDEAVKQLQDNFNMQ